MQTRRKDTWWSANVVGGLPKQAHAPGEALYHELLRELRRNQSHQPLDSVNFIFDAGPDASGSPLLFFLTLVTGPRRSLRLKLSDTRVCEPQVPRRARI